jgi:hypothetical protein
MVEHHVQALTAGVTLLGIESVMAPLRAAAARGVDAVRP